MDGDGDGDDELTRLKARVRELEQTLSRERAQFAAVFEHIPTILYVKDAENRYVYGSPHGFRLWGIEPKDALGRTDAEIFPAEAAARFAASDRRILDGEPARTESYAVPFPGGPRHFAGVRFPLMGDDQRPTGVCGFAVDVTDRVEMSRELERLATTDSLTSLANRRKLDEVLDGELLRAARSAEPLSLLLCDVDHFKRYNDHYGHAEGDACLAQVASALAAVARRPADLAARWGGEEFALVLPGTDAEGAIVLAEKLRQGVRDLAIAHAHNDGREYVTVSVGVATVTGAWTRRELVELTDSALYVAKGRGRDCHAAVSEEHPPASVARGA